MPSTARSVLLLLFGAALGAGGVLLWRSGEGEAHVPGTDELARVTRADAAHPETGPGLKGAAPRTLEDLEPSTAETAWLRSALARERERLAAARVRGDDSGVQVLGRVLDFGTDPALAVFTSFDAFRDRVRPSGAAAQAVTPAADGALLKLPPVQATTVIELGPGTFRLDDPSGFWGRLGPEVASVEVRGAGMDATTVVSGHQWAFLQSNARPSGRQVTLRDLTFDGQAAEGTLLDLREATEVRLERVRVRGWQLSGHAAAIGASARTYLVADACEFDGGGRTSGWAISLRGPGLVWARGCVFSDLGSAAVIASGDDVKGGFVRLEDCTFVNARVLDRATACPVEVRGARVELGSGGLTEAERAQQWGQPLLAVSEGVVFSPGLPRCTLRDLLEVLRRTSVPETERITRLALEGLGDGRPTRFTLETQTGGRTSTAVYTLVLDGGRVARTLRPQAGGHRATDEALLARVPSLLAALEQAALPSDVPMRVVEYGVERGRAGAPDSVAVWASNDRGPQWSLDPTTGAVLRGPSVTK